MENKIRPIPKGCHSLSICIPVNDLKQAHNFYQQAFGAIAIEAEPQISEQATALELSIGDSRFKLLLQEQLLSSSNQLVNSRTNLRIHLYLPEVDKVINRAVELGAKLVLYPEDSLYGDRIGAIADPFGYIWYLATHLEDVSVVEIKKRAAGCGKHSERLGRTIWDA